MCKSFITITTHYITILESMFNSFVLHAYIMSIILTYLGDTFLSGRVRIYANALYERSLSTNKVSAGSFLFFRVFANCTFTGVHYIRNE